MLGRINVSLTSLLGAFRRLWVLCDFEIECRSEFSSSPVFWPLVASVLRLINLSASQSFAERGNRGKVQVLGLELIK